MEALTLARRWDVPHASLAVVGAGGVLAVEGDDRRRYHIASLSKLLCGLASLVAIEEGSVSLGDAVGQDGCTFEHLLAHAGGYAFDGRDPVAPPGVRRIYSNTGIELAARHIAERTGMPYRTYLAEGVLEPLGMAATQVVGSPAHGIHSTVADLARFVAELLAPRLVAPATLAGATRVHLPGLAGTLPGVGRQDPLDWGLTFEIKAAKSPHWTGSANSPETFGHFGGSGTFLWVDPLARVGVVCLTDRPYDAWALAAWPPLADAVLAEVAGARSTPDARCERDG